jgi:hypothetical protein
VDLAFPLDGDRAGDGPASLEKVQFLISTQASF